MTEPRRRGRPPNPEGRKPTLTVRIAKVIREQAEDTAKRRGETLGSVIEAALKRYVARHRSRDD